MLEKEETCCSSTRDILEYMLGRSAWSFEEAKNAYTLSSFYSIFLKEINQEGDIKKYLSNYKNSMKAKSLNANPDVYGLPDNFFTDAKITEIEEILQIMEGIEEQDVLKLKSDIEANNTVSRCWQRMNYYRNNAICLRCSGSVNTYYDSDTKKYKVNRQMCGDLLSVCYEVWSYIANVTWAGDLLHRFKKYSVEKFDNRVSTTSLSKEILHTLWECQQNVTLCQNDNTKLDAVCSLVKLSQVNQDLEGSTILYNSATSV